MPLTSAAMAATSSETIQSSICLAMVAAEGMLSVSLSALRVGGNWLPRRAKSTQ